MALLLIGPCAAILLGLCARPAREMNRGIEGGQFEFAGSVKTTRPLKLLKDIRSVKLVEAYKG